MFAAGPNGSATSATFFSLIGTAKANDLDPYAYLRYLFSKIPSAQNETDFLDLLPNRIDQTIVEAAVTRVIE